MFRARKLQLLLAVFIAIYSFLWRPLLSAVDLSQLEPTAFALLQYDSRDMRDYWQASAVWNHRYCLQHGHRFLYYATREGCHYADEPLATPWCKVKAMLSAMQDYPDVQFFLYMDSDAVIDKDFAHQPLQQLMGTMQQRLEWDVENKPIVFNQDGPCWWCRLIKSKGYTMCLNAGTVAWYRHPLSEKVLRDWWVSSMDSYTDNNPIRRKFRLKWPWEQDRQMAVYNRTAEHIQIASQPQRPHMQTRAGHIIGWCLSHLPGTGCFVSHFCANSYQKQVMRNLYGADNAWEQLVSSRSKHDTFSDRAERGDSSEAGDSSGLMMKAAVVNVTFLQFHETFPRTAYS